MGCEFFIGGVPGVADTHRATDVGIEVFKTKRRARPVEGRSS